MGGGSWEVRDRQTASAAERRSRSSREMLSVDGFAPAGQPVRRSPGSFASAARDDLLEGATSGDFDAIVASVPRSRDERAPGTRTPTLRG